MAQSNTIQVVGAVTAQPSTASLYSCTLTELLSLSVSAVYESVKGNGGLSIASTDMVPFDVPFEGIIAGRFFAIRVLSGQTVKVLVTTGLGVFVVPVSDLWFLHNPLAGSEFTAIQIVGTADLAYVLCGDVI